MSNRVSYSFARKLDESGVTVAEWVVLREMYECSSTTSPGEVARLTGLTKGAVSKLIDRLLAKKFVTREVSTEDRRYQDLHLTNEALSLLPKLARLADENDDQFFSTLTKKERRELVDMLQRIAQANQLNQVPIE